MIDPFASWKPAAASPSDGEVVAECIGCGHILPLTSYVVGTSDGLCEACCVLTRNNHGPCSDARGCLCGNPP